MQCNPSAYSFTETFCSDPVLTQLFRDDPEAYEKDLREHATQHAPKTRQDWASELG